MEIRAPGAAKGGLPVAALPGVASSTLPGVTLGALLVKDQRHPGWALNCLKHLKNISLHGFLEQKPWSVETQLETIILDEDFPAKGALTGCGTVARKWVPGLGFRVPLGSATEEVTSSPRGPFLGLTVDSPSHSPQDPDCSSLMHAAPGLTLLHLTALHTALGQSVCAALCWQAWAQTHLLFHTCSPSWMSPCLSNPVGVPTCPPGIMPAWTS